MNYKKLCAGLLSVALLIAAAGISACNKKTNDPTGATSETQTAETVSGAEAQSAADATAEAVPVTDAAGEPVTDAAGEVVTELVTVAPSTEQNSAAATQSASPSQEATARPVNGTSSASTAETGASVTVTTDKAGPLKAGDKVTLTVRLSNAKLLACFTAHVNYDAACLTVKDAYETGDTELSGMLKQGETRVTYGGFVMKTTDVDDAAVFEVEFEVNNGIAGNPATVITTEIGQYLVGTDSSGAETSDLTRQFEAIETALTLQG